MSIPDASQKQLRIHPLVSVVIGSFNRRKFLRDTVESVRAELEGIEREILIVDGGSTDGTTKWLLDQKDVITIVQHNRGTISGKPVPRKSWGYFMNLGFMAAHGKYVCMLSDDCLVVPDAIKNGVRLFEQQLAAGHKLGAVAFYFRDWPGETTYRVGRTWGDRMFVNHGLYLKQALSAVGYADEQSYRFYHADGDLLLRMWEAGYSCIDSPDSYIEHYGDASPGVRRSNMSVQQADWDNYTMRWEPLGEPAEPWLKREFVDPRQTAEIYWRRGRWARPSLNGLKGGRRTDA